MMNKVVANVFRSLEEKVVSYNKNIEIQNSSYFMTKGLDPK